MPESKSSAYTTRVFAEVMSELLAPVVEKAHEVYFVASDEWKYKDSSRDVIEDYAKSSARTVADAFYIIEKPHKFLEEIAEWIENQPGLKMMKKYEIEPFGSYECENCHREFGSRYDAEQEEDCK